MSESSSKEHPAALFNKVRRHMFSVNEKARQFDKAFEVLKNYRIITPWKSGLKCVRAASGSIQCARLKRERFSELANSNRVELKDVSTFTGATLVNVRLKSPTLLLRTLAKKA